MELRFTWLTEVCLGAVLRLFPPSPASLNKVSMLGRRKVGQGLAKAEATLSYRKVHKDINVYQLWWTQFNHFLPYLE